VRRKRHAATLLGDTTVRAIPATLATARVVLIWMSAAWELTTVTIMLRARTRSDRSRAVIATVGTLATTAHRAVHVM